MAKPRKTAGELARLLHAAALPIYVLDDDLSVVFLNRACQEILGPAAKGLLGRRCVYHCSPELSGPDAVAARLCPPPTVLAGDVTASVCRLGEDGRLWYRRARFTALRGSGKRPLAVVAILDPEDLSEPPAPAAPAAEAAPEALHQHIQAFRREAAGRYGADRLLGNSPAVRRAREQVELAAAGRASVLVIGQRGSGRQHVAAAVHYGGDPERLGSLIPLACSVLGADLIHSTVTALAANPLGEAAARSTLLLNEVDQLPLEVQGELAAIFSGRFPVRLIASAQQPLAELVRRGKYREDLAAVLSTVVIELPPLGQRREDLPLLAQIFLEQANARGSKQIAGFTHEAIDQLDAYPWPGNVDELAQMVAEAHRQAGGPEIGAGDLPERIRLVQQAAAYPRRAEETIVLDEFLDRVQRELIRRAVARAKGNKAKAARLLGLTRPRLYRRMVQLGLE